MFYGISMEDYYPTDGDFTNVKVTGNTIDARGAMIRRGIGMGPLVGCVDPNENPLRSRGAIVTDNTLQGDHMAYGFVVAGVENWTVTGNVDLSTHLVPVVEDDCMGNAVDAPSGFQLGPGSTDGTFQPEFEEAVLGFSANMWPFQILASEPCLVDRIGAENFADIRAGNRGEMWPAIEEAPNGERIANCLDIFELPDTSDMTGNVGVQVMTCAPSCLELRVFNLAETDTADFQQAVFVLDDFMVPCAGLPATLGPQEETSCTISDGVTDGFHVLRWYGFPGDPGSWIASYPFEEG